MTLIARPNALLDVPEAFGHMDLFPLCFSPLSS